MFCFSAPGEHIGCPFATQEESGFEDELPAFSFLSFDPIMVAEQFTLMDAVRRVFLPSLTDLVASLSLFDVLWIRCKSFDGFDRNFLIQRGKSEYILKNIL